ncbi:MAG: hypothetical protein CMI09_10340 [Oceanospirillaceae bacterium]|nr:hypothetical protein [Oceanospirillaceae bacterium]
MEMWKKSALAIAMAATLAACSGEDGSDGKDGAAGATGAAGTPITSVGGATLVQIGRYESDIFDDGGAEIVAFDATTDKLFVVNSGDSTIDVLDLTDPANPTKLATIDVTAATVTGFTAGGANSVATKNGTLAVAVENDDKQANGQVYFYNTDTLAFEAAVEAGALPDMVTFTHDGAKVLAANEGEPNDMYTVDPEGSITIIDVATKAATTADFTDFNALEQDLLDAGVRIFGYDFVNDIASTVAQDLEPEYITISEDNTKAFVALQENNALAVVDIANSDVTEIISLGYKDHSVRGNGIDGVRDDEQAIVETVPVFGMYQPDSIASYTFNGNTYIVTANEGDAREYLTKNEVADEAACEAAGGIEFEEDDGDLLCFYFKEEERVRKLDLNTENFTNEELAKLGDKDGLGDLTVTMVNGLNDEDTYDEVYAYGARSFSIWNENGDLVYDSGDQFEQIIATLTPNYFNASNDKNEIDNRSDNKGPEPEGIAIGTIDGRTFAFIGLERQGGIMVYDVTNPFATGFVGYTSNRDFSIDIGDIKDGTLPAGAAGDLAPEGMEFVSSDDSPNGKPLVIVGNEVSGTTTIYEVK